MKQKKLLMGNEAVALGALRAGVGVAAGYPGTPSTEVIESIAKYNDGSVYVEWSVNEKSAMEVAAGAAYAGQRVIVTMKQVGLNVASDPLMSLAYVGIKGGMVVFVADDPGPISSQTEQDTRTFAGFAKLPLFDPSSPEEAYLMMRDAFELSEKYSTPVFFRSTTRICHANSAIETDDVRDTVTPEGFVKDSKWVIFPRLSYAAHKRIEERNADLRTELSAYRYNELTGSGRLGVATGGVSYAYTKEALSLLGTDCKLLKVATPFPFPEALALRFLEGLEDVLVTEELDPVIERELTYICGKHHLSTRIHGKLDGVTPNAGENSTDLLLPILADFLRVPNPVPAAAPDPDAPKCPVRPPVLCAGCPHRASFYAVKQAMKGKKAFFGGDIGCYTLGNAQPLDMTDTCLCMGAGITVAQGIKRVQPDTYCFAFVGDSTFFHTGLAGVANAVYNRADITVCVLDNSTTAMTGHQPNPSTGFNAMGEVAGRISIEKTLAGLGVEEIATVDPLNQAEAVQAALHAAEYPGVAAIIFRSPCIAVVKPGKPKTVDARKCVRCRKCIRELGCPAIFLDGKDVRIDPSLCTGCGLCGQVCPTDAIV